MSKREQSPNEELANTITHGLGILFCLIAMPFLLYDAFQNNKMPIFWAVLVFGTGMLMVYTSSTLYHAVKENPLKDRLQVFDHISIYFLIAGTYTPLIVQFLIPQSALIFLTILWSLVFLGLIFKLFFTKRFKFVSVLVYLVMGWLIVFIIEPILKNVPVDILWWVAGGGLSYTVGVFFYVRSKPFYFHAVWHTFVLGGTIAHYVFIYKSVLLKE